jgi:hypothetical protein
MCEGAYDNAQLLTDLNQVDDAFRAFDPVAARNQLSATHRALLCIEEPVDPHGMARMSRQLALAFFLDQDEEAMRRWTILSRHLAPDLPWYADMEAEHPFRLAYTAVAMPTTNSPDAALLPPKGGAFFSNGRYVDQPSARIEMPAFIQVADKKKDWVRRWWQDGSAWPDHALGPAGPAPKAPKWIVSTPIDPTHAENAGKNLFSSDDVPVVAVQEKAYTEAEIAAAQQDDTVGTYRDPFEDARRRAIRRETFERSGTNSAGDEVTVKTEVVTYKRERSGGQPVTYEIFDYWTRDHPTWSRAAASGKGSVAEGYLQDWVDARPPPNTSRSPLVWVSVSAAEAYCASFGLALNSTATVEAPLKWELRRRDGKPVRVNAKGKTVTVEPDAVWDDTGFRCGS